MREDWAIKKLGDVADVISGKNQKEVENPHGDYPIYGSGGIFGRANAYICEAGTTVIGRKGTINTPIYVNERFWNVDTAFGIHPKSSNLLPKFLYYFCKGFNFKKLDKSTTIPSLAKRDIVSIDISLPPLPEQKSIVAKIEELFSELDNGIANLQEARRKIDIYRQSVLKKAFEGELTKDWRSRQPNLPTGEELLAQIQTERQRHYEQQLADWKSAVKAWEKNGKQGRKPGKPKDFDNRINKNAVRLFEISKSFILIKLGDLTLNTEYGSSAKSQTEGDIPVLRMGNIQNGRFDWKDLVFSTNKDEIDQYLLKYNDVLFNRTNSPELVGKTAVYKGEQPAIFAGYLIRINQIEALCAADYLNYYLNSHPAKVYGSTVKTDGVNQSNINGQKLKEYPFPYCSVQEQTQIVQEIESRLSVCDKLTETIDTSMKQAEAMRQSILKKAFEGRL